MAPDDERPLLHRRALSPSRAWWVITATLAVVALSRRASPRDGAVLGAASAPSLAAAHVTLARADATAVVAPSPLNGTVVELPDLVVEYLYLRMPDGAMRASTSFDGHGLNGKVERVPLDAVVRQRVVNALYSDTVTVHHHGVHMRATPYFDGSAGVAQAGVPAGRAMALEFRAWPAGTHWYHSHSAFQAADGLKGVFIVDDPRDPWLAHYSADVPLLFYEASSRSGVDEWVGKELKAPRTPQDFEVGVVNGVVSRNASADGGGGGTTRGYVARVGAGRAARLRLVYGGTNYKFSVRVAEHNLTVIARDGTYVKPVETGSVEVHAGERYDVLVRTREEDAGRDFEILFEATIHGAHAADDAETQRPRDRQHSETFYYGHMNATLRVGAVGGGGGDDDEAASATAPPHADERRASAPLPDAVPFVDKVDLAHDHGALRTWAAAHGDDAAHVACPREATREIPLVITAGFPFQQHSDHRIKRAEAVGPEVSPIAFWRINNNSWVDPSAPLYVTKGACCVSEARNYATYVERVAYGEVIDLVVVQNGFGSTPEIHPMHLHGNKFWVVASGELPYPGSVDALPEGDVNLDDPVYVDTFAVRTGRYYVLRWRADNPGMWHFHCHLLYHMQLGLQLVFNVAEERQPEPTDAYWAGQEPWPLSLGPGTTTRHQSGTRIGRP